MPTTLFGDERCEAKQDMNGRQLRKRFAEFNARYFAGKLPPYSVRVVPQMTKRGESGRCLEKRRLVELQRGLSVEETITTLLHEMAHAATSGRHGMSWKKEMIRLREAGAPLTQADLNVSLSDWDGVRVTKAHFRSFLEDLLSDIPGVTLSKAIWLFITNEGGPDSIAAFRRTYLWAAPQFKAAKAAFRRDARLQRRAHHVASCYISLPDFWHRQSGW